ncbi:MAG TPA: helix-turn-helix domain-containing protein [Solirubrobacteraceae bacterium]|jgi:cytoskeletal protein RodZ|nr:helix-turn-helix domain-containing protein [Solirubrobacteraceae bacterium]
MAEIGATLREARMRARIDVSEIEAQTKIRAKYLRALENEEWDLLPGPTFVRSFLRTYAQALGLDEKTLVDEYRREYERPLDLEHQPPVMASSRRQATRTPTARTSRGYLIAVGVIALLIVLLLVGLMTQKKGGPSTPTSSRSASLGAKSRHRHSDSRAKSLSTGSQTATGIVAVSVHPTGSVWVCLIGDGTRKAIPGVILQPSYTSVTYHARRFTLVLGNDEASIDVNGRPQSLPTTSQAIGYSIDASGRHPLSGRLPACK